MLVAALVGISAALSACSSVINTPQGKIVSVTERGVGFVVGESTTTQTPEVKFGFFSSAVVIEPTSTQTNGVINTPNFANNFSFDQTGALQLGIGENIASGNDQALQLGTNSTPIIQPIVPK